MEILAGDLSKKYHLHCVSNKKNKVIRIFDIVKEFYVYINKTKLVIIDTYSTSAYYYALAVVLLSRVHNKPYMLILSGGNLKTRLNQSNLFKVMLKNSVVNISPSKFLYEVFYNYNTVYLPNYIDLKMYPFQKRKSISPKLLWVRSLHKIYNPQMAILVLNKVIKNYPTAKLCMVGPFKDESINEVKNLIKKLKLESHVNITGRLEKEDWIKKSEDYDIFINTTNYDNHPVSLLEAMALGLPIVSTNVGGIPNFLTHNKTAKLVEAGDVLSMESQISDYLKNDIQRMQISLNARKIVEDDYSKEKIIAKWLEIIDEHLNCHQNNIDK